MPRTADHAIAPQFLQRHSPRAMSGEPIARGDLLRLFEAARWAPSCANSQPWRFIVAQRDTPEFKPLFDLLDPGNQEWCVRAAALVVLLSSNHFASGKPSRWHSFDAGAAWMSLALQGSLQGLVVHGMGGFDEPAARSSLHVPDGFTIECMVAVGLPGDVALLSEKQQAREAPSGRQPVAEWLFHGRFGITG